MAANAQKARSWDFALTAIGIFAAAFAFAASLYLSRSIGSRLDKLQRESTVARAASVLQALDQDVHHLGDYTTGYAMWDDTYEFLKSRAPAYLQTNYTESVMAVTPTQLVGIYDLDGSLLFAKALDEARKTAPVPPGLKAFPKLESFAELKKAGEFQGRIEWIGNRPYLVAICPITDSAGTAPIRGYLLFGEIIGEKMLDRIHTLTGVRVKARQDRSPPKGDFEIPTSDLGRAEVTIVEDENGAENAKVLTLFREDNTDQRSVLFELLLPANASIVGRQISQTVQTVSLLVSAGFAVFVALSIREFRRRRSEIQGQMIESHELRAARERAEELAVSAKAAEKAKSSFLAMMSHEIRTPLNAIIGYAELLRSRPDEETVERLEIIGKSGGVLQRILDDILDFSKIEAGKLAIQRERVNLRELIADVVDTFWNQAQAKQIEISSEVSAKVPEVLMLDPTRLKQVLGNLCSNAVKFTEYGTIRIAASRGQAPENADTDIFPLRICVEDEGIGIGNEEEHSLFQPFNQADSRVARRHEGTGLGLAISRRLCELMAGRVSFHRRAEKGSIFAVDLPAPLPKASAPAAPNRATAYKFDKDLPILVVDDNAVNARLLKAILERFGLHARIALSGHEALRVFLEYPPEVIFLDVQMPEMDGLETTARIRAIEREGGRRPCLIIAVTADILMCDRASSLAAGMDGFLSKPINVSQVEETLNELLKSRSS